MWLTQWLDRLLHGKSTTKKRMKINLTGLCGPELDKRGLTMNCQSEPVGSTSQPATILVSYFMFDAVYPLLVV